MSQTSLYETLLECISTCENDLHRLHTLLQEIRNKHVDAWMPTANDIAQKAFIAGAKNGNDRGKREEHARAVAILKDVLGVYVGDGDDSDALMEAESYINEKLP